MAARNANIYYGNQIAAVLKEAEEGYSFAYNAEYLKLENPQPVSLTLPLTNEIYHSSILFPFFDGLIPEGWMLDIAEKNWKLDERDRMGLLLACCRDCIGAVSVMDSAYNKGVKEEL
ncbi:MAG: HipA N-terminal domain-containing protein [Leptospirales bacterium]